MVDDQHDSDTRPKPGPGDSGSGESKTGESESGSADPRPDEPTRPEDLPAYGEDESQDYVDRSKLDFDPEDGLYTGTAVTGESEIPNPEDVSAGEGDAAPAGDGDNDEPPDAPG